MNITETRILTHTSLTSDYAFVSMPKTAWYWLDDLVRKAYPTGGYRALIRGLKAVEGPESLSANLHRTAQEHCERQMVSLYNLANDNAPANGYGNLKQNPALPSSPDFSASMPCVYQLFRFIPHATYLTTVWERRNYHLKG
mgnify:CR=1 FL=1